MTDAHAAHEEMQSKSTSRSVTNENEYIDAKTQITGFIADCQDDITEMQNYLEDAEKMLDKDGGDDGATGDGGTTGGNDGKSGKKRNTVKDMRKRMKKIKTSLKAASAHNEHLQKQMGKLHDNVRKHCDVFDPNRKVNLKANIDDANK